MSSNLQHHEMALGGLLGGSEVQGLRGIIGKF